MEKAIIIGAFEDIGFQLCKGILEDGIEVAALHLDGTRNPLTEERRLEIGRNANFTELELEQLMPSLFVEEGTVLFLDCIEQIVRNEGLSTEMVEKLSRLIKGIPAKNGKILWLLPLSEFHPPGIKDTNLARVIKLMKEQHLPFQLFYFPNIEELKRNRIDVISDVVDALMEIVVEGRKE